MYRLHYDVIYHPSRINSQYLKTWEVDRPALYRRGVHTTPDIFSCQHIVVNIVAPCKGIEDSLGFWIPRRGFPISGTWFQSLSVELGFWIPILSRIPDSLSCILDSKAQDSRRKPKANISRFRNLDSLTWGEHCLHSGTNLTKQFRSSNVFYFCLFFFWEKRHRDLDVNISLSLMYLNYFSYLNKWILSYLMPARLLERWFLKFLKSSPACFTKGTWSLSVHISKADKTTRMFILRYI